MIKDLTESYESLISRYDKGEIMLSVVFDEIQKLLKSAEPIRCKDCKYSVMTFSGECKYCDIWFPDEKCYMDGDYYCASAERRTDEVN